MYKHPKTGTKHPEDVVIDLLARIMRPTVSLPGAACRGKAPMFDADATPEQREQAAQVCAGCPVAKRCAEWSAAQPNNVSGILSGTLLHGPYYSTRKRVTAR
jgi:hypothetical protein